MKIKYCKFIFLLFIIGQLVLMTGCKTLFVKDPQKAVRKQQQKETRKTQRSYNKSLKTHFYLQDKKTQRRMKKKYKKLDKKARMKKSGSKCI